MNLNKVMAICIGVSLLILGYSSFTETVSFEDKFLFSCTTAAFFFILSDWFGHYVREMGRNGEYFFPVKRRVFANAQVIMTVLSIMSLFLLPHFADRIEDNLLAKLSDTFLLLCLGTTVCLTSIKSRQNE